MLSLHSSGAGGMNKLRPRRTLSGDWLMRAGIETISSVKGFKQGFQKTSQI